MSLKIKLEKARQYVSDLYPSPGWKARVAEMPTQQIFAIYYSSKKHKRKPVKEEYQQLNIFDYMEGRYDN